MVETKTLRLKLSSANPSGFNFLQSISNSPKTSKQIEPLYVAPVTKQSSHSKLSTKSLELCTENLGCETGTVMMENSYFSIPKNVGEFKEREKQMPRPCSDTRKKSNFPPLLTTMRGSNFLQVSPIREGGRLVIEAVEVPTIRGCFQAERSNGRLKLSLFRDSESDKTAIENEIEDLENETNWEEEENQGEEFEEDCQGVISEAIVNGDIEGNNVEVRGETGIGKFQRLTRCNEDGRCSKGICNWEPFWVATS